MTTKRALKMKSGEIVPAGARITPGPNDRQGHVHGARPEPYLVRYSALAKAPTVQTLDKWNDDGIAKSVNGKKVEPDGHDDDGFPSWFLALGLI